MPVKKLDKKNKKTNKKTNKKSRVYYFGQGQIYTEDDCKRSIHQASCDKEELEQLFLKCEKYGYEMIDKKTLECDQYCDNVFQNIDHFSCDPLILNELVEKCYQHKGFSDLINAKMGNCAKERERQQEERHEEKQEKINEDITLDVVYVRHMYSCANYSKKELGEWTYSFIRDPSLHCTGIKQAELLGQDFARLGITFDLMGSSQLFRAIQTGLIIRDQIDNGHSIPFMVVPHINETTLSWFSTEHMPDNTPQKFKKLSENQPLLDHYNMQINTSYDTSDKSDFIKYENNVLPDIVKKLYDKSPKNHYTIMIVSHSGLLKKYFNIPELDNGQMLMKRYTFFLPDKAKTVFKLKTQEKLNLPQHLYNTTPYQNYEFYVDKCTICEDIKIYDSALSLGEDIDTRMLFQDFLNIKYIDNDKERMSLTYAIPSIEVETIPQYHNKVNVIWTTSGQACESSFFNKISDPDLSCAGIKQVQSLAEQIKNSPQLNLPKDEFFIISLSKKSKNIETAFILRQNIPINIPYNPVYVFPFRHVDEFGKSSSYRVDEDEHQQIKKSDKIVFQEEFEFQENSEKRYLQSKLHKEKENKYVIDEIERLFVVYALRQGIKNIIFVIDTEIMKGLFKKDDKNKDADILYREYSLDEYENKLYFRNIAHLKFGYEEGSTCGECQQQTDIKELNIVQDVEQYDDDEKITITFLYRPEIYYDISRDIDLVMVNRDKNIDIQKIREHYKYVGVLEYSSGDLTHNFFRKFLLSIKKSLKRNNIAEDEFTVLITGAIVSGNPYNNDVKYIVQGENIYTDQS